MAHSGDRRNCVNIRAAAPLIMANTHATPSRQCLRSQQISRSVRRCAPTGSSPRWCRRPSAGRRRSRISPHRAGPQLGGKQIKKDDKVVMVRLAARRCPESQRLSHRPRASAPASAVRLHPPLRRHRVAELQLQIIWEEIIKRFRKSASREPTRTVVVVKLRDLPVPPGRTRSRAINIAVKDRTRATPPMRCHRQAQPGGASVPERHDVALFERLRKGPGPLHRRERVRPLLVDHQ